MSDGPHRALPMRAAWKRAAARADNNAFDVSEVAEAISAAVVPDFQVDVTPRLLAEVQKVTNARQPALFMRESIAALEKIKREIAIEPRARDFVDRVILAINQGKSGLIAVGTAVEQGIRQMVANCIRQIEEFYHRKASSSRGLNVRARLDQAASGLAVTELAQRALTPKSQERLRVRKKTGLDDGVSF